jgi:hypothetical protein
MRGCPLLGSPQQPAPRRLCLHPKGPPPRRPQPRTSRRLLRRRASRRHRVAVVVQVRPRRQLLLPPQKHRPPSQASLPFHRRSKKSRRLRRKSRRLRWKSRRLRWKSPLLLLPQKGLLPRWTNRRHRRWKSRLPQRISLKHSTSQPAGAVAPRPSSSLQGYGVSGKNSSRHLSE